VNIRIKNTQRKRKLASARVKTQLKILLQSCGQHHAELSVLFTGDRAMRTLNRTWRGKDRTTDVLSFAQREGAFAYLQPDFLGDIVISVPVADKQARAAGHSLTHEIDLLLVHGLLHLLGFDHEQGPMKARQMKRKEMTLLQRISR
jgi:probable rRNA maturation factor